MRYHDNAQPQEWTNYYGSVYRCNHPVYRVCTLYKERSKGLCVIQQRYNEKSKATYWSAIDPWLTDKIYLHDGFKEYFDSHAKRKNQNGEYPTVTVRQIMWALRMDDEDHLRAACWNLLWALNQRVTHPELDDRFVPKMKSSNDEQLITVVCSSCGRHFEAPTEWWVRKRAQYTNIPDGVITTCPHCENVTIVREVKPDE